MSASQPCRQLSTSLIVWEANLSHQVIWSLPVYTTGLQKLIIRITVIVIIIVVIIIIIIPLVVVAAY